MKQNQLGIIMIVSLMSLLSLTAISQGMTSDSPAGKWKTIDDVTGKEKSIVTIWEDNGKIFGKVETVIEHPGETPKKICDECPGDLKGQPIEGLRIMWDLQKDGDTWSGGQILDPKNGKVYKCKIWLEDKGKKLMVRGYIGFSLLGRSQEWIRLSETGNDK